MTEQPPSRLDLAQALHRVLAFSRAYSFDAEPGEKEEVEASYEALARLPTDELAQVVDDSDDALLYRLEGAKHRELRALKEPVDVDRSGDRSSR